MLKFISNKGNATETIVRYQIPTTMSKTENRKYIMVLSLFVSVQI